MNQINEVVSLVVINIFSAYLVKIYLDIFFEIKATVLSTGVWVCAYVWQIFITFVDIDNTIENIYISIAYITMIVLLAYNGSITKKIVFVLIFNAMWMICEVVTGNILSKFNVAGGDEYLLGSIVSKILLLLLINVVKWKVKINQSGAIPFKYFIVLSIVPLGSIYVIAYIFFCSVTTKKMGNLFSQDITYLIILIINIIVFVLYEKIVSEYELRKNHIIFKTQIELCRQNALVQEQIVEETKRLRHDLKYLLFSMKRMVNERNYEELSNFLNEQFKSENLEVYSKTNNIIVDSLLNYLNEQAKKKGFTLETEALISKQLSIEDSDMSLLLGNIIDNALEAIERVQEGAYIKLYIKEVKGTLVIVEQNKYNGQIRRGKRNELVSSKKEKAYHGIGMTTIEKVIKKYKGTYLIEDKNNIFTIKAILYIDDICG